MAKRTKKNPSRRSSSTSTNSQDEFVVTKEYRRFAEFCDACRRHRYIGLCYGPPGVGKTLSGRQYAKWDYLEPYLDITFRDPEDRPPIDFNECRAVFYTPTVANTPRQIESRVESIFMRFNCAIDEVLAPKLPDVLVMREWVELLIVDEADRLKFAGLEQIRDVYDRAKMGLVLVGMPGIEKRLARYPQLYSRVGFVHRFKVLSTKEMRFILQKKWETVGRILDQNDFTDEETVSAILRITGGNFRLLDRLLAQVERVLQINELQTVTKDIPSNSKESLRLEILWVSRLWFRHVESKVTVGFCLAAVGGWRFVWSRISSVGFLCGQASRYLLVDGRSLPLHGSRPAGAWSANAYRGRRQS